MVKCCITKAFPVSAETRDTGLETVHRRAGPTAEEEGHVQVVQAAMGAITRATSAVKLVCQSLSVYPAVVS